MQARISTLILYVVIFQLLTYSAVLVFGGEFRDLREYSYNTLVAKTETRAIYVRNQLQEKPGIVREYADELNEMVTLLLARRGRTVAALRTDELLVREIMESSTDTVIALLRRSMVNDAYLILDTGALYGADENTVAALYLRDLDPNSGAGYGDLLMEFGDAAIARELGITRDFGWEEHFAFDPQDEANFDFYYTTLETARENSRLSPEHLGYWSGFSQLGDLISPSMKYTMPLVAEDGTVYGVLGIGLMEKLVRANMPANDLLNEEACYVLGRDTTGRGSYDAVLWSGSAYSALMGKENTLHISGTEAEGIYCLDTAAETDLLGSIQDMELYDRQSPYAAEQWALLCVSERASVMHPLEYLQQMLGVSTLLSLVVAMIVAAVGCRVIIKPLTSLSGRMRATRNYNEVIRFQPSGIYEIEEITDAITQLQINVRGFSSQVSKMITIADVGLGTFMLDRTDDSVFVGQSLINVLQLELPRGEDIVMSRQAFLDSIQNPGVREPIAAGLDIGEGQMRRDSSNVHQIERLSGGTAWLRLGFSYSPATVIGVVQDITDNMVEKNRIEHERDHDALTGLLTRHAYYHHVERLFHDRDALGVTAFVMIDLDNLKYVNDTYGHDFGDEYIKTAAAALKDAENHGGTVARLSGDEFNICLPGFASRAEAMEIIEHVRSQLLQGSCLLADGTHYKVSASFGVAWYPDDADSYELLMKYADFAMYAIKHSVKGGIAEFDINAYSKNSDKLTDLEELNRIIADVGVRYAFQSVVSVETGQVYGYEALMRVQSEIFRSPMELLSTAKTSARLHDIERLTWTKALADFQALLDAGVVDRNTHLFVNSIANHRLEDEVLADLEKTYPHLLDMIVMEILESESADEDVTSHKEQVMMHWGGQMALDDYGTGYNNEYALLNLHPNIIKIDRSIIDGCDKDADRRMIIENLVKLSKAKGIQVLAEGVETQGEMETVIECGVDFLQGFYLARPVFEPGPLPVELAERIRLLAVQRKCPAEDDWVR